MGWRAGLGGEGVGGKGQQPGADVLPEWTKLEKLVFTCPRGAK